MKCNPASLPQPSRLIQRSPGAVNSLRPVVNNRATGIMNIKKSTQQIISLQLKLRGWDGAFWQGTQERSQQTQSSKEKPPCHVYCSLMWSLICLYVFNKLCDDGDGTPTSFISIDLGRHDWRFNYGCNQLVNINKSVCKTHLKCCCRLPVVTPHGVKRSLIIMLIQSLFL